MAPTLTYPKRFRLSRSSQFRRVRQEGRTFPGRFMIVGFLKEEAPSCCGLITSRRVGNAVTRNAVRRRFRELVRLSRSSWQQEGWLVLVARNAAARATWEELEAEWHRLARKAGLLAPVRLEPVRPARPASSNRHSTPPDHPPCSNG